MHKFGITMRITNAPDYDEPRNTIAMDWSDYMLNAFPDSQFMFVPNIETDAVDYIDRWGINVLVLSGGDDPGVFPTRDKTEHILLEYALKMKIPVIAVCRGLQLVHVYFGGKLETGDRKFIVRHKANSHLIDINNSFLEVNSYHSYKIDEESIHRNFDVYARCKSDNTIEGIKSDQILGMMWHPERDKGLNNWNKVLIDEFLGKHAK